MDKTVEVSQGARDAAGDACKPIWDLVDDPALKERLRRICQQRDDAINAASVAEASLSFFRERAAKIAEEYRGPPPLCHAGTCRSIAAAIRALPLEAIGSGYTGTHHCHWPGCDKKVVPAAWGCLSHWRRLPKYLRDKIWASYRPRQEITKTPSREYVIVAREVQTWIEENVAPLERGWRYDL